MRYFISGLAACFAGLALHNPRATGAEIHLTIKQPEQILYKAIDNKCNAAFIPDSPARAFKRSDGSIEFFSSHYVNWALVGKNFKELSLVCQSIMNVTNYSNLINGLLWLQASYTIDGKNIQALASQDLTRVTQAKGCDSHLGPGHCWLNQIVAAHSNDMGNNFVPDQVIASFGNSYPTDAKSRYGFFATTNIVKKGRFFYVMMYETGNEHQKPGTCLFRSDDVTNHLGWRGWDGSDFTYKAGESYGQCSLVFTADAAIIRSIEFVTSKNVWIAITAERRMIGNDKVPIPGFYTSTSSDLIHWGSLTRIWSVPLAARLDSMDTTYSYPSLIDPQSKSRNFETIDHDFAFLFFNVHHLNHGSGTMDRDIDYISVRVE